MKKKKVLAAVLAVVTCIALSACSTTAWSNAATYSSEVSDVLTAWFGGSSSSSASSDAVESAESDESLTALSAPENFTVDDDGNYSFDGVDGADYYILYFCEADAVNDEDDFLYSSSQIEEDGSGTYSGNCADLFQYGYGDYLVKVFAYPELGSEEYDHSTAASVEYVVSGEISIPEVDYCWDIFQQTLSMQISNVDDYIYQVYPDEIIITLTNEADDADVIELSISEVSDENYSVETTDITAGATYSITACAVSSNDCVTNQTTDSSEAKEVTLGENNVITSLYFFKDDLYYPSYTWPMVGENFNLEEGGSMGAWYFMDEFSGSTVGNYEFFATPATTDEDCAYYYTVESVATSGSNITGYLIMYEDGTFEAYNGAAGPVSSSIIQGTWNDNGDGTATLNYNHSTTESAG